MSEKLATKPLDLEQFDSIEALAVNNADGQTISRRVYGIDEEGKKHQLKGDEVLEAHGYKSRNHYDEEGNLLVPNDIIHNYATEVNDSKKKPLIDRYADKLQAKRIDKEPKEHAKKAHKQNRSYVRDELIKARNEAMGLEAIVKAGGVLTDEQSLKLEAAKQKVAEGSIFLKQTTSRHLGKLAREASKQSVEPKPKKKPFIDRYADSLTAKRIAKEQEQADSKLSTEPALKSKPLIDRYADKLQAKRIAKEEAQASKLTAEQLALFEIADQVDSRKSLAQRLRGRWSSIKTRVGLASIGDFKAAVESDRESDKKVSRKILLGATAVVAVGVAIALVKRGNIDLLPTKGKLGDGDGVGIRFLGNHAGSGTLKGHSQLWPQPTSGRTFAKVTEVVSRHNELVSPITKGQGLIENLTHTQIGLTPEQAIRAAAKMRAEGLLDGSHIAGVIQKGGKVVVYSTGQGDGALHFTGRAAQIISDAKLV